MKKVLFTATLESHIRQFHLPYLEYFKKSGWQVDVACRGRFPCDYVDNFYDIPFERSPYKIKNFWAYTTLKKVIDQSHYDIIHCHTPMGSVLTRLAARAARKSGTKVLYTAHGFHFFMGAPLHNWIFYYPVEKFLSQFTDCLITLNEEDYHIAKSKFHAKRTELIHGIGVSERYKPISETEKFELRDKYGFRKDDFLLIYVAEFTKNKNHQMLIKAISTLSNKNRHIKLLLVGKDGGTLAHCRDLCTRLSLSNVIFPGYRYDLNKIVPMCNLAISCSNREGLPMNVAEAMASGLPIIATNIRGTNELVVENKNGYLIEKNNVTALASAIMLLFDNPSIVQNFGTASLEIVKPFLITNVQKKVTDIYISMYG